jgi:hypothetical protein
MSMSLIKRGVFMGVSRGAGKKNFDGPCRAFAVSALPTY